MPSISFQIFALDLNSFLSLQVHRRVAGIVLKDIWIHSKKENQNDTENAKESQKTNI